ncbi:hypothetical protein [Parvibium lacunae]|nr:hypothetical protein [Parvibium lacunae]
MRQLLAIVAAIGFLYGQSAMAYWPDQDGSVVKASKEKRYWPEEGQRK